MQQPRFPHRSSGEHGFSLIEVSIAAFVFAIGALGLLRLMISGAQGVTTAERLTEATVLAESKLAELMELAYDAADLAVGAHVEPGGKNLGPAGTPYTADGAGTGAYGSDDGWFARSWTVTAHDVNTAEVGDELKLIAVTVRWRDRSFDTERRITIVGGKSIQP